MLATTISGAYDIALETVPDPKLLEPTDALVRVTASCICGSDLWPYRGVLPRQPHTRIGHEFVGVVEEVGPEVGSVKPGDFVIAPFVWSDGTCPNCRNGVQTSCLHGGGWGSPHVDGGQGEAVRVPQADGTLVATPEMPDDALVPALLTLSDVMSTGHHAAVSAGVTQGSNVVVVGDGAVGLCAVLASVRLGASRVVAMSRHEARQAVARRFGATDVVAERGEEGAARIRDLFDGIGADVVLECVGTNESMKQALDSTRPGGRVGYVGMPNGVELPVRQMFSNNIGVVGGVAPARHYIPQLLPEVLDGRLDPSPVFDLTLPLTEVVEGYRAMDERRAIKVLLQP
ncbi:MAG: zinc-dependent alcohol dehydrogenase family protein [Actinomycetales bacterium]